MLKVHNPGALELMGPDWKGRLDSESGEEGNSAKCSLESDLEKIARQPRTVLFLAKKAYFNQLRTSAALRRSGWTTVAIVLNAEMRGHNDGFFDHVLTTDLRTFLDWWSRSRDVLLHTQGWLFRYHIPTLVEAFKPEDCRHVVELMDLNSFWFPQEDLPHTLQYMKVVWGHDCEENHRVQVACQQYICENADGVIFPGDEGHQEALGLDMAGPYLNFLSYPLEDFFASPAERTPPRTESSPRLVFAGGVPTSTPRRIPEIFADAQLVSLVKMIVACGLSLDVYNNPLISPADSYAENYPDHMALAKKHSNYRFLVGGMPWEVTPTLASYDYGLMLYDFSGVILGERHFRHLVPTKLFLYLEAGLPILVSDRWRAVVDIVEEFQIGRAISSDELHRLPEILAGLDLVKLRENVEIARRQLSMDAQIPRLLALYGRAWGKGTAT